MIYTIDFETEPFESGTPKYPVPVGVSVKRGSDPSQYTTITEGAVDYLSSIISNQDDRVLFHNAKFDLRVMNEHLGIPIPHPSQIIDTMIMAYLIDPREASLGLKELAHKYLGIPPNEQTELREWLSSHGLPESHIYKAPFELLKRYAEQDTDITYKLYQYLLPKFSGELGTPDKQLITNAMQREMAIIPITISMEQEGVHPSPSVVEAAEYWGNRLLIIDEELEMVSDNTKPGTKAFFNILRSKGLIDEDKVQYTAKGNARYGRELLASYISDKELLHNLTERSVLQKLVGTYLRKYADAYERYGRFYPYYQQTRGDNDYGTRTGRFSSNLQQLPKEHENKDYPFVRSYIVAGDGNILIKRDFNGQEVRVAAHYAEGALLQAYKDNPALDVHTFIKEMMLNLTGLELPRKVVKTIVFLKFYGGGAGKLAIMLGISEALAYQFFDAFDKALPEIKALMRTVEDLARGGTKIKTWGGRSYDVEETTDGRELYYKLGNVLIQGSSADMTKEAMARYHYSPKRKGKLILQVHDELVVEVKEEYAKEEMALLKWAMDMIPGWDVPLLSEGAIGHSFGEMTPWED